MASTGEKGRGFPDKESTPVKCFDIFTSLCALIINFKINIKLVEIHLHSRGIGAPFFVEILYCLLLSSSNCFSFNYLEK